MDLSDRARLQAFRDIGVVSAAFICEICLEDHRIRRRDGVKRPRPWRKGLPFEGHLCEVMRYSQFSLCKVQVWAVPLFSKEVHT